MKISSIETAREQHQAYNAYWPTFGPLLAKYTGTEYPSGIFSSPDVRI